MPLAYLSVKHEATALLPADCRHWEPLALLTSYHEDGILPKSLNTITW